MMHPDLIVIDHDTDLDRHVPLGRFMLATDYIANPPDPPPARVLNLCRYTGAADLGPHVSLVAEARGAQVTPGIDRWFDPRPSRQNAPTPAERPAPGGRFRLAVLHDPHELQPPSRPATLAHLADVARSMGIETVPVGRNALAEIHRCHGLLIRETTSIDHHSFRFAQVAEQAGLPVIDDTASILRCTNKAYLAELLSRHHIAIPATRLITTFAGLEQAAAGTDYPAVLKIPGGAFGHGVKRVYDAPAFIKVGQDLLRESPVILAQEYVPTRFDWRIGVLGGEPLFAARYHMCKDHWQIIRHGLGGRCEEGVTEAVHLVQVPSAVLDSALRAARLIGRGFYGVDLKETDSGVLVIEVNDNPNLDVGLEDAAEGNKVYRRLLAHFLEQGAMRSAARAAG